MTTDPTSTADTPAAAPADAELTDDQLEAAAGGVWGGPDGKDTCTPTLPIKIGG